MMNITQKKLTKQETEIFLVQILKRKIIGGANRFVSGLFLVDPNQRLDILKYRS